MRFKIVRLMGKHNGPKWIMYASGGLELLKMVSELDTRQCASEDAGPQWGVDC